MTTQPEAKRRKVDAADGPLHAYRELLQAEVTSTRTKWTDFLKAHKRDRRFLAFGRSDRERERAFKEWLVELGERKREAQLVAEDDFLRLLDAQLGGKERERYHTDIEGATSSSSGGRTMAQQRAWAAAKKTPGLDSDPRYEAVGSSTRRAELFAEWVDGKRPRPIPPARQGASSDAATDAHDKVAAEDESSASKAPSRVATTQELDRREQQKRDKAREAELALRAREEQVRREREQAESRQRKVLSQSTHAEDIVVFKQMLIDYVRDPLTTFDQLADGLGRSDRRFSAPSLRTREKEDMLAEHVRTLLARRRKALHGLFAKTGPSLAAERDVVLPLVREEDEWERAELGRLVWGEKEQRESELGRRYERRDPVEWPGLRSLEREWDQWHEERLAQAEREFKEMLSENAFLDFWGRLKHHKQTHDPDAPPAEDLDSDDEDAVGMLEMARQIDLDEVSAVLEPDARFRAWKHRPELRERWIREHMERLAAPKQTVHGAR